MLRPQGVLLLTFALACGGLDPELEDEGALATPLENPEWILAFVNSAQASWETLQYEVRLNGAIARRIPQRVIGDDGRHGSPDDQPFTSIADLDAVRGVGPAALRTLDLYVKAHPPEAPIEGVTVEGVTFPLTDAADALTYANTLTIAQLDDDVGLDPRAANAIFVMRPHASLESVAQASFVGASALTKLRDYAARFPIHAGEPTITSMRVEFTFDIDPYYEESLDGALVHWDTQNAADCSVAAVDARRRPVEERPSIGARGSFFFGGFAGSLTAVPNVSILLTCRNAAGVSTSRLERLLAGGTTPIPPTTRCDGAGGTYDGVTFTRDEECQAVAFMNRARWSQMGAMSDTARRFAYENAPDGIFGHRRAEWTNVSAFAALAGVGRTAVESLKSAAPGWTEDQGGRFDTVALTWANRASLDGAPISLDRVYVTKKTVYASWPDTPRACLELRDAPAAPNYVEACLYFINADSAPGCSGSRINTCTDAAVGQFVRVRGALSVSGNRVSIRMHTDGPTAARPTLD